MDVQFDDYYLWVIVWGKQLSRLVIKLLIIIRWICLSIYHEDLSTDSPILNSQFSIRQLSNSEILVTTLWSIMIVTRSWSILQSPWHRTNCKAQPTACTIRSYHRLMSATIEGNCLVSRIQTGHVTLPTVNTKILID